MSANLPARRPDRLDDLARLGTWLALSETGSQSPEALASAAALRLYYASELGVPPLAAAELSVIRGKLVVSARLLRALAHNAGYVITRETAPDAVTAVLCHEDGTEVGRATFTMDDARTANLVRDKGAWQTHPQRMLWARASANVIYDFAPQVALGMMTRDEAAEVYEAEWQDVAGEPTPDDVAGAPSDAEEAPNPSTPPSPAAEPTPEQIPFGDDDDGLFPPNGVPEGLTIDQGKKLNVLVGNLREHGFITTDQVWRSVGKEPQPSDDGELHWSPLRDSLTKDEASALIDRLERYEQTVAPGGFYMPKAKEMP